MLAALMEKYNSNKKTFLKFKKSLVKDPKTVQIYKQPLPTLFGNLKGKKGKEITVISRLKLGSPFIDFNRRFYKAYLSKTFNNPCWFLLAQYRMAFI